MIKKLFKISILCMPLSLLCGYIFADSSSTSRKGLTKIVGQIIEDANSGSNNFDYGSLGREIQTWIFGLVGIIAFVYIVWIGGTLLFAPGNMEEMSKAMKSLGYIVLGLALIPFAWLIISFLTNLNI